MRWEPARVRRGSRARWVPRPRTGRLAAHPVQRPCTERVRRPTEPSPDDENGRHPGGGGAARRPVLDRPLARRGCEVSAVLVGCGRLHGGQPIRLILYFRGDLLEFRLELAPVVGAEEQFTAADQDDAQIGLGAATVTAVCCGQRARGGQNSSHVASSLARRAVVPGSTSNQAENVPARGFSSKLLLGVAVSCRLAANVPYAERYGFALLVLGGGSCRPACRFVHEDVPGA